MQEWLAICFQRQPDEPGFDRLRCLPSRSFACAFRRTIRYRFRKNNAFFTASFLLLPK